MNRTLVCFWRALRLRCPNCGRGPIFRHWLSIRDFCYHCGFWLEREEGFYTGAIALNLSAATLLLSLAIGGVMVLTWPEPPWTLIQFGAVALMVVAPIVFWPFSKTLWLALDVAIRTVEPEEVVPGFHVPPRPPTPAESRDRPSDLDW